MRPIPTTVVSGFPAIGKSFLAQKFPSMARDLESSDFHWIVNEHGEKEVNPEWPKNYIDTIKVLDKSGMYRVILVSSHEEIRKEMAKAGIKYTNICPTDDYPTKAEILTRCVNRRSPGKFIMDLQDNYSKYVKSMVDDPGATACLQLDEKNLDKWDGWALME